MVAQVETRAGRFRGWGFGLGGGIGGRLAAASGKAAQRFGLTRPQYRPSIANSWSGRTSIGACDGKAALVAGVSGAAGGKVKAGELLSQVAGRINGKGGGRPDLAQGGGEDGPALVEALADVPAWVAERLRQPA